MENKKIKICGITTRPETARVMFNNLEHASKNGYECFIICQPHEAYQNNGIGWAKYIPVKMNRGNVSPFEIFKVIWQLRKIFRTEKFDIVIYASSNAGLYAAIAGKLANIPIRIYCQWGLPYVDLSGAKRKIYRFIEKLTCYFSTFILPDSISNLKYSISDKLYKKEKGVVLGMGSAQGVNLTRFDISKKHEWRNQIRSLFSIPQESKVFCFVGRIVPQKGINELLEAFLKINKDNTYLLVVGAPDEINHINQTILKKAKESSKIIFAGSVPDPERYHAASDFFILPSYREGFPNTILEAGALGIPSIVTAINGMTDLVDDGNNGLLCDVKSSDSVFNCIMKALSMDGSQYKSMSEEIYNKVRNNFDCVYIRQEFLKVINHLNQK